MRYYVYIIQSILDNSYYKGFTENPLRRLVQHNNGESHYTSSKIPWKLVYVEAFDSKTAALIREKNIKKATIDRLLQIIASSKNIIAEFG